MREFIKQILNLISHHYILISGVILIAITVLSLTPLAELPSVPGGDKTHHLIAYSALMFPVALARPKYWILLGLLFIAWSAGIELIQPYLNRYGEWADMAANTLGLLVGALIAKLVNYDSLSRTPK